MNFLQMQYKKIYLVCQFKIGKKVILQITLGSSILLMVNISHLATCEVLSTAYCFAYGGIRISNCKFLPLPG